MPLPKEVAGKRDFNLLNGCSVKFHEMVAAIMVNTE